MEQKKFCTYPLGYLPVIGLSLVCFLFTGLVIISYFNDDEGLFWEFLLYLFVLGSYIYIIKQGNFNFVKMNVNQVKHKKETYRWDEVYITMYSYWSTLKRANPYFIYFSDHYLTEEEIEVMIPKSNGFYMMLTKKRADYLLKYYKKEILILNDSGYQKQVLNIVKAHNTSVQN